MTKLIRIYFLNALNPSRLFSGPNRRKSWGLVLLMVLAFGSIIGMIGMYGALIAQGLVLMDALIALPRLMVLGASLLVLLSAVFSVKGILFAFGDADMQLALPVPTRAIVGSRVVILYIYELLFTLLVMAPTLGIYAYYAQPNAAFYVVALLLTLFVPVLPIVVGSILGALVSLIATRFRADAAVRMVLTLVLCLAIMAGNMALSSMGENTAQLANAVAQTGTWYLPAQLYADALTGDIPALLVFVLGSAVLAVLFVLAVGRLFGSMNARLTAVYTKGNFKLGTERAQGKLASLYKRELKTYFSSTLYFLNTGFGIILLLIAAVAAAVLGGDKLDELLGQPGMLDMLLPVLPFFIALFVGMTCTTGSSISMEGECLWVLKTLPASPKSVLASKLLVNLTVILPVSLLSALLFVLRLPVDGTTAVALFVVPTVYAVFTAAFGLAVNLRFPKLDWKTEAQVVKQSTASFLSIMGGMIVGLIPLMLSLNGSAVWLAVLAVALVAAALLAYLFTAGARRFAVLGEA